MVPGKCAVCTVQSALTQLIKNGIQVFIKFFTTSMSVSDDGLRRQDFAALSVRSRKLKKVY